MRLHPFLADPMSTTELSFEQPASAVQSVLTHSIETTVRDRYSEGARAPQPALCCPIEYQETQYLTALPDEIIAKDYGCGDPTRFVNEGETVVDLGSGAGKNCYIIAQKVGANGRVIGVDMNDDMLALSRGYQAEIAATIGFSNVEFVKAKIQDLALDLAPVEQWLNSTPIGSYEQMLALEAECDRLRREQPLIGDSSVDVVVSNCVLNLVRPGDKQQLFKEIYRVLKRGGRAVISDIVCDEPPTAAMIDDPELWSGCISGAFLEVEFLQMFEQAGFYGVEILARQTEPWQTIDGIEFRSITVRAYKGKDGICLDRAHAVIYKGPWKCVLDDDGHRLDRGERMAVCEKTFGIYTDPLGPYSQDMIGVPPYSEVPIESAPIFDCSRDKKRNPQETKGLDYRVSTAVDRSGSTCC
jgi:arsenite methyltransferase